MKTLFVYCEKGGVGKSFTVTQLAAYCAYELNLRVLLLDLDQQANTYQWALRHQKQGLGNVEVSPFTVLDIFYGEKETKTSLHGVEGHIYAVKTISDDKTPKKYNASGEIKLHTLSQHTDLYATYLQNVKDFIQAQKDSFDICLIDLGAAPDIRFHVALSICDNLLTPIEISQECLEGVSNLFSTINESCRSFKSSFSPTSFLGLLPNKVKGTEESKKNASQLFSSFGKILIPITEYSIKASVINGKKVAERDLSGNLVVEKDTSKFAFFKERVQYFKAQADGISFFNEKTKEKVSSDAKSELSRVFFEVITKIGVKHQTESITDDEHNILRKCKKEHGSSYKEIIFAVWQRGITVPRLTPDELKKVRDLKKKISLVKLQELEL